MWYLGLNLGVVPEALGEDYMRRREFITLLGGSVAAWPLTARAQQPAKPVVGYLSSNSAAETGVNLAAFRRGLSEMGFVEGRNVAIEYRWAEGHADRLPALAADLVQRRVAVIFASGNVAIHAAEAATRSTPIVFNTGDDPVATGIVPSLNRPGGNVTGTSMTAGSLVTKRLQLLHELVPTAARIAMLVNSDNPNAETDGREAETAARSLGFSLFVLKVATGGDLDAAFATLAEMGADGLLVNTDSFLSSRRQQLVALAARREVPALYSWREFVEAGGLMCYGATITDSHRQAAIYVGRILKGEKPADLPVMQPTKFELVINLKTAKALGLTVPPSLLATADEVIE
jgi:putative ABC transport system substrate-binding protein